MWAFLLLVKNDSRCKPLLLLIKKIHLKYRVKASTMLFLFHKCVSILRAVITLFGDSIFAQIPPFVPLMGVAPWACVEERIKEENLNRHFLFEGCFQYVQFISVKTLCQPSKLEYSLIFPVRLQNSWSISHGTKLQKDDWQLLSNETNDSRCPIQSSSIHKLCWGCQLCPNVVF